MNNNVITNMSETMTTEEYIKLIEKRKQEDFEKQFDEELRQAREKALKEQVERAKEDYFITLVNKIADVESEIGICETILEKSDTSISNNNYAKFDEAEIRKHLTILKRNLTKAKNELDKIIKEENENEKM